MVELSNASDPYQHGFPNVVFILPAIIVFGLIGKKIDFNWFILMKTEVLLITKQEELAKYHLNYSDNSNLYL